MKATNSLKMRQRIASNLAMMRSNLGYTQEKLAAELEITRANVSKWQTASTVPEPDMLDKIYTFWGYDPTLLMYGEVQKGEHPPQYYVSLKGVKGDDGIGESGGGGHMTPAAAESPPDEDLHALKLQLLELAVKIEKHGIK